MPRPSPATRVRLKPADPFELIRWLARSQNDPRKAVAELVQNSLDANARHIRLSRRRIKGVPVLVVEDDGEGVIPEMGREEALRYLAQNIGHSRKRNLSVAERRQHVIAGQYGVGLLGFWSLGHRLEMRSRVAGSPAWAMRLAEEGRHAEIVRVPHRLDAPPTYTEVIVSELHAPAQRALVGRRIADYLAAELRGQLLGRSIELTFFDGMARGLAQKNFPIVPRRFVGERLNVPATVDVTGQEPARVELYLAQGSEKPAVQLACMGTVVADDLGEMASLGLDESPWVGRSLCGLIDFPGFTVPPGTRRGIVPNVAAAAFAEAMDRLKPIVEAELARLDRERAAAADRGVVRDLRRALRGLQQRLPQYEIPNIAAPRGEPAADSSPGDVLRASEVAGEPAPVVELFAPGPRASVRIEPAEIEIAPGSEKRVRAVVEDDQGRRIVEGVAFTWGLRLPGLVVRGEGPRPAVCAAPAARIGTGGKLCVEARRGERVATAEVDVEVVEPSEDEAQAKFGIPEPRLVSDPGGLWRSRLAGAVWEINEAHDDYVALRSDSRARLRYLLALFSKEIVQRSYGRPGTEEILERLVEILAHAERNLRGQ